MQPLQIATDVPLSKYSTMRLGGVAKFAAAINSRQELADAYSWASSQNKPLIIIGSGSNIVWRDEGFQGLLAINKIKRFEVFEEDEHNVYLTVGAGENWDETVARSVELGLTGIEALSLIPGTTGATPIQNVGAYGQDVSQTISSLEAYDTKERAFINIAVGDCGFGYRSSRFNGADKGRFLISSVTFHLTKGNPGPPFYPALQKYLDEHSISDFTPQTIRQAVIAIRASKLPDPALIANNGSFFANPIISEDAFTQLQADYPDIPHWPATMPSGNETSGTIDAPSADSSAGDITSASAVKVPAAWLLEQAGFKDYRDPETGMATWAKQPLVLVNESAKNTADLLTFKQKIIDAVHAKFNITLVQEPELLPQALPKV